VADHTGNYPPATVPEPLTLVLGGARSGKSAVAERLIARHGSTVAYIATAAYDDRDADLAARIAQHRARRPSTWRTIEAGADLADALVAADRPAIVDSLGAWVAATTDFAVDVDALCRALVARSRATVIVSEEVGLGVHPSTDAGRHFRDVLGDVNREVAAIAGDVLLVVAGRVVRLDPT
jgi:adenosyl cobinamide kinase/adenosyl cobinamide phosphate guanylyltransferase